jgi:hypothetical protein
MRFRFGDDYDRYLEIESKTLENAIKLFKVQELWPEKYIAECFKKGLKKNYNDAGEYVYMNIPQEAYIPVFIFDRKKEDELYEKWKKEKHKNRELKHWNDFAPVCKLPLSECINVRYDELTDAKYLPLPVEQENAVALQWGSQELADAAVSKVKARKMACRIGRQKKDIEKKMEDLTEQLEKQKESLQAEIEKFQDIIRGKIKTLYAIETYLGVYEEITRLASGSAASPDEPITVYQQKCYMDEEVGLTEVDGTQFSQGLDYENIEQFDSWITKRFKRYLYKEKSIMAWEVRRRDRDYGDKWENNAKNPYNHQTYYLLRNGDNLYRIFSGVGTEETLYPTKEKMEEVFGLDEKWKSEGERVKRFYEKYLYVFIMLQGLVDRTDVFGTNFAGKIDFINPLRFNKEYIVLVRDAEPDNWLADGRPTWEEYKEANEKTITLGSRVLVNYYKCYPEPQKNSPKKDISGDVFIVEDFEEYKRKEQFRNILKVIPKVVRLAKRYNELELPYSIESFEKELKVKIHRFFTTGNMLGESHIVYESLIIAEWRDEERKRKKPFGKDFFENIEKRRREIEKDLYSARGNKYKIYYQLNDVVYNGWGDVYGHDRKNRKGYWASASELINIDTVTYEEIRYYLNNRLHRKDYIELIPFMKRVYLYKKQEYEKETPFVKLIMGKSGIADESVVREAITWWKIKNKWKRWVETDDAKAYRMIMRKLTGSEGEPGEGRVPGGNKKDR